MSVQTFVQPQSSSQSASSYPAIVDGAVSVLTRLGDNFAPHAVGFPNMTIAVDAGHFMIGQTLVEKPAQTSPAITPPANNARIDRVVIDNLTGLVSVVTGAESATPSAPDIPAGKSPVAQIILQVGTTAITNSMITDERDFGTLGSKGLGGLIDVTTFTTSGTYTPPAGTQRVIVEAVGGGGSGGGAGATNGSTVQAASGGGSGAYAKALLTSGFSGVAVTVGAGGAAPAAGSNSGNPGSASSFGNIINCPGGTAGIATPLYAPPFTVGSGGPSATSTGGNIINSKGGTGGKGIAISTNAIMAGDGAYSVFGAGGVGPGTSPGSPGVSPGSGGGGSPALPNTAARSAGAGAPGIVIVYAYG
jgi:hypothetical protein